jgi:hypothetical protein
MGFDLFKLDAHATHLHLTFTWLSVRPRW